jgi:eukaryotic-like serine/threonine-protein kinase
LDGQILDKISVVKDKDGTHEYKVLKLLGAGTQGEVYLVTYEDNSIVLKWYFPRMATQRQQNIIQELIDRGSPSNKFLWPIKLVLADEIDGFGYLMPFKEEKYKTFSLWLIRKVEPSFRILITAAFELARNFRLLHAQVLSYSDISLGNVFFDPSTGDIRIGDTDNIVVNGQPSNVSGTPRFMAPELVYDKEASPNEQTDLFSLSVLLFYILFVNHPLEGKKETAITNLDPSTMTRLYGKEALFIFDPKDDSNRPDPQFHNNANIFWKIYPSFLRELFTRAFTKGIDDPLNGRIREGEWMLYLTRLRDLICLCSNCHAENFFDPDEQITNSEMNYQLCYNCGNRFASPLRLHIDKKIIMFNHDTKLYKHHIDVDSQYDFSRPIAEVTRHPTNPNRAGLKNITNDKWVISTKEGKTYDIEPTKNVPIELGTKIYFGKSTGEIRY